MTKLPLHFKILIGLALGVIWAFTSSALGWNDFTINWIDPFGTLFIRMLKFIAVPLVLFSIISGVAGLSDVTKLGRMGAKTLGLYLFTTVSAISIGLILVNLIKPGSYMDDNQKIRNRITYERWLSENDLGLPQDGKSYLSNPDYSHLIIEMDRDRMLSTDQDILKDKISEAKKQKNSNPMSFMIDMVPENILLAISNNKLMLQVIFFAIFFGITTALMPKEKSHSVISFINGLNDIFLKMVNLVMQGAPFFVFALLAGAVAKMADTPGEVVEIFLGLGTYSLTLIIGLVVFAGIFYPLLLILFVKDISYGSFFRKISSAQFLAFSTSSSAATLPVTMKCVEDNIGVSRNVSSFVLPIGATVNMDGTSMYQAVAVIFLAQLHLIDLTLSQQMTIVFTATLASIGAAAVPSAGLIMLIIVLQSVGLNPAWVAIIFPVDRILDMMRTVVNVTGDAAVSTIIAKTESELSIVTGEASVSTIHPNTEGEPFISSSVGVTVSAINAKTNEELSNLDQKNTL